MTILQTFDPSIFTFSWRRDTYVLPSNKLQPSPRSHILHRKRPSLLNYKPEAGAQFGAAKNETRRLSSPSIANLLLLYGKNTFDTPIPAFAALFAKHGIASSVFQVFCVALWCLDKYWYCILFTLLCMLVMFERTVVQQRARTLTELCSMLIEPYPMQCYRKMSKVQTDELLPGDVISLGECLDSLKGVLY